MSSSENKKQDLQPFYWRMADIFGRDAYITRYPSLSRGNPGNSALFPGGKIPVYEVKPFFKSAFEMHDPDCYCRMIFNQVLQYTGISACLHLEGQPIPVLIFAG